MKKLTIDGLVYILESDLIEAAGDPVIVRGDRSGVFFGTIESREGRSVVLRNVRRIWYWSGAASLSQLATDGVKSPENCKFPPIVNKIEILDVIEILSTTKKAQKSISEVLEWKK